MFFDLESCPDGWSPVEEAEGRVIVGIVDPASKTLGGTVGDPLEDLEDRTHTHAVDPTSTGTSSVGTHTHSVNPPSDNTSTSGSHSHTMEVPNIISYVSSGTYPVAYREHIHTVHASGSHDHTIDLPAFDSGGAGSHSHSVDIPSTASSAASTGEVMPYIQLLVCRKD